MVPVSSDSHVIIDSSESPGMTPVPGCPIVGLCVGCGFWDLLWACEISLVLTVARREGGGQVWIVVFGGRV